MERKYLLALYGNQKKKKKIAMEDLSVKSIRAALKQKYSISNLHKANIKYYDNDVDDVDDWVDLESDSEIPDAKLLKSKFILSILTRSQMKRLCQS